MSGHVTVLLIRSRDFALSRFASTPWATLALLFLTFTAFAFPFLYMAPYFGVFSLSTEPIGDATSEMVLVGSQISIFSYPLPFELQ